MAPGGIRTTLESGSVVTVPTGPPVTVVTEGGAVTYTVTTLVELGGTVIVTVLGSCVLRATVTTLVELGGTVIVVMLGLWLGAFVYVIVLGGLLAGSVRMLCWLGGTVMILLWPGRAMVMPRTVNDPPGIVRVVPLGPPVMVDKM